MRWWSLLMALAGAAVLVFATVPPGLGVVSAVVIAAGVAGAGRGAAPLWRLAPGHGLVAMVLAYEVLVGCARCSLPAAETRLFFGVPTALLGLVAHGLALGLAFSTRGGPLLSTALAGASLGLGLRLWLGGWWCPVCLAGHAAMLGLVMTQLCFHRPWPARARWLGLLTLALVVAAAVALWPAPKAERKPLKDLLPGLEEGLGRRPPSRLVQAGLLPWTSATGEGATAASTASLDRDVRWGAATAALQWRLTLDPDCHRCVASWQAVSRGASAAVARGELAVSVALVYNSDPQQTLATLAYAGALRDDESLRVVLDELLAEGRLHGMPADLVRSLPASLRARELVAIVRQREADLTALLEQAEARVHDWGSPRLQAARGGTTYFEASRSIDGADVQRALAGR
jgi:hypothetical protein